MVTYKVSETDVEKPVCPPLLGLIFCGLRFYTSKTSVFSYPFSCNWTIYNHGRKFVERKLINTQKRAKNNIYPDFTDNKVTRATEEISISSVPGPPISMLIIPFIK